MCASSPYPMNLFCFHPLPPPFSLRSPPPPSSSDPLFLFLLAAPRFCPAGAKTEREDAAGLSLVSLFSVPALHPHPHTLCSLQTHSPRFPRPASQPSAPGHPSKRVRASVPAPWDEVMSSRMLTKVTHIQYMRCVTDGKVGCRVRYVRVCCRSTCQPGRSLAWQWVVGRREKMVTRVGEDLLVQDRDMCATILVCVQRGLWAYSSR